MTWEEIIIDIRSKQEFKQLVEDAYLSADLVKNVNDFETSEEFEHTLKLIQQHGIKPGATVLDVGAGNGIATLAFARKGYNVLALEPDVSATIGAGAIKSLVNTFSLSNVTVITNIAEQMPATTNQVDVVYIRQAVHHAQHLNQFIANVVAVLKPKGLYLAVRDHVVYNEQDKQWFLQSHPLHKYYGGENAFTLQEYLNAMQMAGLTNIEHWAYYDSPLNYLPITTQALNEKKQKRIAFTQQLVKKRLGFLAAIQPLKKAYEKRIEKKLGPVLDERLVPGRPYSFKGTKP